MSSRQGSGSMISKGKLHDTVDPRWNAHEFGSEFELRTMQERMGRRYKEGRCFLVVRIGDGKWIKAEKGGDTGKDDGGIHVFGVESSEAPEDWKDEKDEGPGRYSDRFTTGRIDLGEGKEKWTVEKLRGLLGSSDDPDYNVLSANCWNFANLSARGILKWIIDNTKDEQMRTTIVEKVKELKKLERIKLLEFIRSCVNPDSPRSKQVLEQTEVRLSATEKELHEGSSFRRERVRLLQKFVGVVRRASHNVRHGHDQGDQVQTPL